MQRKQFGVCLLVFLFVVMSFTTGFAAGNGSGGQGHGKDSDDAVIVEETTGRNGHGAGDKENVVAPPAQDPDGDDTEVDESESVVPGNGKKGSSDAERGNGEGPKDPGPDDKRKGPPTDHDDEEIEMIFPTNAADKSEEFREFTNGTHEDVYINVENLVSEIGDGCYHVKVEQRGRGGTNQLGLGTVELTLETKTFNLYEVTEFEIGDNYSKEYFVLMSLEEGFPRGEDQTFSTNFKLGHPTPIIDYNNVVVTNAISGGEQSPEGIIFILAREFHHVPIEELSWVDYYNWEYSHPDDPLGKPDPADPYNPANPVVPKVEFWHFCDEVKMIGITNAQGIVEWIPPRETLKLGGYVLLQVTPKDYIDNLNATNPDSHDGAPYKAVHLMRDGSAEIHVVTTYDAGTECHDPFGVTKR
ncbi:MAG: hypothetical protein FH749_12370 [Firmicutes bacterium]|nr:hypothetical protein [Bacillota bacterium]